MSKAKEAVEKTRDLKPQTPVEIMHGMTVRRTEGGIPVGRIHYTAMAERNTAEWKDQARREYTSQASWDREMEIRDEAGGGELAVADTLVTWWNKIVVTDPLWCPHPDWPVEAGFDHGRTNATAFERAYLDYDGVIYLCGEYYVAGKEISEHAPVLKTMADIRKVRVCYADPSIFPMQMQQSQMPGKPAERAKSINELYVEQGIELFSPFRGDRSDVSAVARMMMHWHNLDRREPTLKIVCRNFSERPQPGLHNWDSPNLLWELMRLRREKLTAQQLLTRNVSEAIVQKDNHAFDAGCKYLLMSHPEPAQKTAEQLAKEAVKPLVEAGDLTSASIRYSQMMAESQNQQEPARIGRRRR
jgi:hypothetical protein